ncbi:hypothetical protein RFN29_15020 [Mesorhizobium sp. VK22B]|uniref:Uncharacterized protein n=1 Tax=Mesorhizobium captivum TaxID=3072319 RepID=A0ABU4Z1F4_9HYPH|nr:hypothetical protein [Mesorhizobium sp. VK22B]MDX8492888.1 hypothetical protein [Mesorhizobium sp. VK22B]
MSADDFNHIATAIMRLQSAMRAVNIEPAIIELASREQGEQLRHIAEAYMRQNGGASIGMDPKGKPVNQMEICGTIVRWPAHYQAPWSVGFRGE